MTSTPAEVHVVTGTSRDQGAGPNTASRAAVGVAVTAFFMVTLDAVVVNVALPSIRDSLGGGVQGLQWVVDGYTLMFAALLLSAAPSATEQAHGPPWPSA